MDIHPGPLIAGLGLLAVALRLIRTSFLNAIHNWIGRGWNFRGRLDPDSGFAQFYSKANVLGLCFFGVLLVLWGLGVG